MTSNRSMFNNNNNAIPRIRRRPLILPSALNSFIYSVDSDSDEEKHNEIASHIIDLEERDRATNVLQEQRNKKKELNQYKTNYQKMFDNMPTNVIKNIVGNDKCSICLNENMEFNETYVITSCYHSFHEKCLKESQTFNNNCPLCRTNLKNTYYKKFQINIINKGVGNF